MALNADVFVEGRQDGAIGFWGNYGDASTLANEVADRFVVLTLFHNSVSARLEVSLKRGWAWSKSETLAPRKNEPQGITQRVAGYVNFC